MVENILSKYKSEDRIGIAYFYFSFQSEEEQDISSVIRILIKQLCRCTQHVPPSLEALHKQCGQRDILPKLSELKQEFLQISQAFDKVFIVIDAMDEYPKDKRNQLLPYISQTLKESQTKSGTSAILKVFVTSRQERDIERQFTSDTYTVLPIRAGGVLEDIARYVDNELEQRVNDHCDIDQDLRQEIRQALVSRSDAM
jgi:hypothetical protein